MFYILVFWAFLYLFFILFIVSGLFKHSKLPIKTTSSLPNISVVIAARNEELNLPDLIQDLISQEYSLDKIEVIFVDDRSTDSTPNILEEASKNFAFIKHIKVDKPSKNMTPKKHALSKGIEMASGEVIITTDADCRVGKFWVSSMAYSVITNNAITIGYSEISNKNNNLFAQYQAIDFLAIIIANSGAAGWKQYWSGTGQNLAYLKDDFISIGGFDAVKNKISGDDMYLVQTISKLKTGYLHIDPNSFVTTQPLSSVKEFLNQRIRWSSNSKENFKQNPLFFMFLLTSFSYNIMIILSIIFNSHWFILYTIKFILDSIVVFFGKMLFEKKVNIPIYCIWSILQPLYILIVGTLGLRGKFTWKT